MNELLGMMDALEAMVVEANRMPFTNNIVIEQKKILQLIKKIRMALQSSENMIRKSVEVGQVPLGGQEDPYLTAVEKAQVVQEAVSKANKIRSGANEYADQVLANLQLVVSKMQKDLTKFEKHIENGREFLEKEPIDESTT
jgi:uncharacterized protein YfeS